MQGSPRICSHLKDQPHRNHRSRKQPTRNLKNDLQLKVAGPVDMSLSLLSTSYLVLNIALNIVTAFKTRENTIEPEAKFLPRNRPSVVPEAQPRALREVYFAVETRPRVFSSMALFRQFCPLEKATSSRKTNVYRCLTCRKDPGFYSSRFNEQFSPSLPNSGALWFCASTKVYRFFPPRGLTLVVQPL